MGALHSGWSWGDELLWAVSESVPETLQEDGEPRDLLIDRGIGLPAAMPPAGLLLFPIEKVRQDFDTLVHANPQRAHLPLKGLALPWSEAVVVRKAHCGVILTDTLLSILNNGQGIGRCRQRGPLPLTRHGERLFPGLFVHLGR